jgi:predicted permease
MNRLLGLARRTIATLFAMLDSDRADAALREEMEAHLAMHIDENMRRGMSPEQARRDALIAAGGLTLAAETVHERRAFAWVENLATDLRYAARSLRAKPGFTLGVILTLGLSIGANAGMFTIVRAVVLRPLPYAEPDRIVSLSLSDKGVDQGTVNDLDYFAWVQRATSASLAVYGNERGVMTMGSGPQEIRGMSVSAPYFTVMGVRPLIGRTFTEDEDRPNQPPVVVLGEQLWRRGFGADSAIVGRTVDIDGSSVTVIGVLPESFTEPSHPEYWQPYHAEPAPVGTTFFFQVVGRLRPNASIETLRAELATLSARLAPQRPIRDRGLTPVAMTLHERRYGERRQPLLLLLGAVAVLLLIACANLSNLALVRAASRQREFAVRLALGAGRWRLVRSMLCESFLLSCGGAALGLALSAASVGYFVRLSPTSVGNAEGIQVDGTVLLFTLGVAVTTGMLFGLIPAFTTGRRNLHRALSAGSLRSGTGVGQHILRRLLVVGQLATALVLLTAAGLVARTFAHVASIDPGFRPEQLISTAVQLPEPRYSDEKAAPFFEEMLARIRRIRGVETATFVDAPPFAGVRMSVAGKDSLGREIPRIDVIAVGPEYFRTLGARLVEGRAIDSTDRAGAPRVVVMNETLARRLYPGTTAIGQTFAVGGGATVIGVAGDVLQRELEAAAPPLAYVSMAQQGMGRYTRVMVRVVGDTRPIEAEIAQIVRSIDPSLPPPKFRRMEEAVAESIAPRKFTFLLLGTFALLAAALAVVGLYAMLAHLVADRTREIGIRAALGADRARVVRFVVKQGAVLVGVGIVTGLFGAVALTRLVASLLSGVSERDPITFAAVPLLLGLVAMLATLVPAWRAARVDPVIALRAE